jgi:hypothetical protein
MVLSSFILESFCFPRHPFRSSSVSLSLSPSNCQAFSQGLELGRSVDELHPPNDSSFRCPFNGHNHSPRVEHWPRRNRSPPTGPTFVVSCLVFPLACSLFSTTLAKDDCIFFSPIGIFITEVLLINNCPFDGSSRFFMLLLEQGSAEKVAGNSIRQSRYDLTSHVWLAGCLAEPSQALAVGRIARWNTFSSVFGMI